jgi:hypothetical protein
MQTWTDVAKDYPLAVEPPATRYEVRARAMRYRFCLQRVMAASTVAQASNRVADACYWLESAKFWRDQAALTHTPRP